MMLTWLLTSTTYGTWLPGDPRGFVGRVRDFRADEPVLSTRVRHNQPQSEYDRDIPGLRRAAQEQMKGQAIYLSTEQARQVCQQFQDTAVHRGWNLIAAAVMSNHFHLVVGSPREVKSEALLRDFKSYSSRTLNQSWGKPQSGRWWTHSGSRRLLPNERAVQFACVYVWRQKWCLARYRIAD